MVFAFEERLTKDIEQPIKSILNEVGFVIACPLDYEIALNDLTNYFGVCVRPRPKLPINEHHHIMLKPYISDNPMEKLQGFDFSPLDPHTDFAYLDPPPNFVFIKMIQPDFLGEDFGKNGIVDAFSLVKDNLGSEWVDYLSSHTFFSNQDGTKQFPILTLDEYGLLKVVRFSLSRIMSHFAQNKIKPTKEQSHMLNTFSKLCKEYSSYHSLKKNDILIVNNHLMLHSRGSTNALYKNGQLHARIVEVAFVKSDIL
ncbi:TauD/TfdA family dioxygenase [Helicobacter pylori]|uniref:TauD/TfdA family dioxygenase n=1 Tax=Helicobacter pylori TaxID=210 RepID=UPI000EB14AF7|nr:TauD/TfdA family dioxygenase [Helicobacter pylori]